ncbi:MAG: DUF3105 domain-containing protein [Anaerolineae bacterium]
MVKRKPRRSGRYTRRSRERKAIPLFIAASALVVFGLLIYEAARPRPGLAMPDLGNQHIGYPQKATYNSSPPTSGPHYETLAPWGVHTDPIPNELQVHNLEDGGVMVQYNCPDGCADLVTQLSQVVERYNEGVILAPYPDMESRIALTAWGRLDTFEEFDEKRIVKFIEAYRGLDHHR